MSFFFEVLIGGLLSGVMYSLVALGFVLIYKASGVFNFAQGSLVFFAALTFVGLQDEPIQAISDATGMNVSKFDLSAAGIAAVLVLALAFFFARTRVGRALRAVADDHQAALAVGIPLQYIWAIVWSVAGCVALVTGLLWGARNGVQFALTFVALKALPVLILGGFESVPGAIVGGLIIGASEKLAEVFLGPYVGGGIEGWFPYVLALLFLLVRPEGLFGEKIIRRI